jgi:glycosyltransferase involved in cell wall biosynthesis
MKYHNPIMFVCPYYPPKTGGVENYVYNIAKGLQDKYHLRVIVITSNDASRDEIIETSNGIKIYRLPYLFRISNTPINPFWYFSIKKIIHKEKPALVNVHSPVPFISDIAALACDKIPLVLTYHSGTMKKNKFISDLIIGIYEKYVFPSMCMKSSKIICPSKFVSKTILSSYTDKVTVISPGVDTTIFHPNKQIVRNKNTILFICRYANMHIMKGFYTLVEAIKNMPNIRLRVIGEKGRISNSKITYLGERHGIDLIREIQKATVLVLPSKAHIESFGMVLIEAMACNTPVIGTRIGGIPEVVSHNKDGLLIPPSNSAELLKAIKVIINDPSLAKIMGKEGYKKVYQNFTWESRVDSTYRLFKQFLTT